MCYFFTDMRRGLQLNLTILVPRGYANGTIRNMGIAGLGYDLAIDRYLHCSIATIN
jgi:hypothetical protein